MSWFIQRKKKSRPSKPAANPQRRPWNPTRTLQILELLVTVATLSAITLGWGSLERLLIDYTQAHDPALGQNLHVQLADAPPWMSRQLRAHVTRIVADQLPRQALHDNSLADALQALSRDPWVRQVIRIERANANEIRLWAQYRQPVALVEGSDGYYLVDEQAVRLADSYRLDQLDYLTLPLITGVAAPPPAEGNTWPGDDLSAGLALVQLLADRPYLHHIRAFDVAGRDARNRVHLVLRTAQGSVRWGLPPGREQAIEPDALVKLHRLDEVYRSRDAIDAGNRNVDIYGAAVFIHAPNDQPRSFLNQTIDGRQPW